MLKGGIIAIRPRQRYVTVEYSTVQYLCAMIVRGRYLDPTRGLVYFSFYFYFVNQANQQPWPYAHSIHNPYESSHDGDDTVQYFDWFSRRRGRWGEEGGGATTEVVLLIL